MTDTHYRITTFNDDMVDVDGTVSRISKGALS